MNHISVNQKFPVSSVFLPVIHARVNAALRAKALPACQRGESTCKIRFQVAGLEKWQHALHREWPGRGNPAEVSQVPLLPSCQVPSPAELVTGNKSKREAVPGQCWGRARLFVWASPCWKPSASSQLARLLPACPGHWGWVAGTQGSCSGLGKRQAGLRFWWPHRAW